MGGVWLWIWRSSGGYGGISVKFLTTLAQILYRLARWTNDWAVLSTGDPHKIFRHWVNKKIGRMVGRRIYLRGR